MVMYGLLLFAYRMRIYNREPEKNVFADSVSQSDMG